MLFILELQKECVKRVTNYSITTAQINTYSIKKENILT